MKFKLIVAPMSGITDVAFNHLCKFYGADLTYTEFISSAGFVRNPDKYLYKFKKLEPGLKAVQLFGNNIKEIIESARILETYFDIIDINAGCPVYKVIKTGSGSELLKKPKLIGEIVKQLSNNLNKPVSVKIRIGIDQNYINALNIARIIEDNGASFITIHGRTQKQMYSGKANWDIIYTVKRNIRIPVIGNGDVKDKETYYKHINFVDGVMIGRGIMKNPGLIKEIKQNKKINMFQMFRDYLYFAKKYNITFNRIKLHAIHFFKSKKMRAEMVKTKNLDELLNIINKYK